MLCTSYYFVQIIICTKSVCTHYNLYFDCANYNLYFDFVQIIMCTKSACTYYNLYKIRLNFTYNLYNILHRISFQIKY